jgi:hypothetical protein
MFARKRGFNYALVLATALALLTLPGSPARTAEVNLDCRIQYEISDGVYVGAGRDAALQKGEIGWLAQGTDQLVRVEVLSVSKDSAFLKFLGPRPRKFPPPGSNVVLIVDRNGEAPEAPKPRERSPTLLDRNRKQLPSANLEQGSADAPAIPGDSEPGQLLPPTPGGEKPSGDAPGAEPLQPLLAPQGPPIGAFTDAYNISQGQITFRQTLQLTEGDNVNYSISRLRTSGSVERIQATPWAFEWSGELSYRDGKALQDVHDYQEVRLELYRFDLFRKFDDTSFVRAGRMLPRELPSVGYIDGVQGEWATNPHFRLGGILGLKPDHVDIDFSVDEPTQVGYFTLDLGDHRDVTYTGTFGLLSSIYKGKIDRLAVLSDQTLLVDKLSVLASSEIDFDVGSSETHSGTRLSRLDVVGSYPIFSHTTARLGLDRFEPLDTAAERDAVHAIVLEDEEFINRGDWRYFAGMSHDLPWRLRLSEEVSVTDAATDDWTLRWNVSLTKFGLPGLDPSSSITLTAYNYEGLYQEGYGGRLSGYIPVLRNRVLLQPDVAFRYLTSDIQGTDRFIFTDVGMRAQWIISPSWILAGGASYAYTEDVQRILIDVALTYKW